MACPQYFPSPGAHPHMAPMRAVDVALCLAVDVSASVSYEEFGLMMGGLAQAWREPDIMAATSAGPRGAVAVSLLFWSGPREQAVALDWMLVDGEAAAQALADALDATPRLLPGGTTALGLGLAAALGLIGRLPVDAARLVVDVSGDGANNQGRAPGPVRDVGVAAGVTINGLAILNEEPGLLAHYVEEVIGGVGSFAMDCADYADFADAIRRKLWRELRGGLVA